MNITYPKLAGFVRTIAILAGWAALTAVLGFLSNQAHLIALLNLSPYIAGLIAGFAGMLEAKIQANGNGALFGAIR